MALVEAASLLTVSGLNRFSGCAADRAPLLGEAE